MVGSVGLHVADEVVRHVSKEGWRGNALPPAAAQELGDLALGLKLRDIAVQIEAVHALDGEGHMAIEEPLDASQRPSVRSQRMREPVGTDKVKGARVVPTLARLRLPPARTETSREPGNHWTV